MRTRAQLKAPSELQNEVEKATAAYEEGRLETKRYKGFLNRFTEETKELESELKAWDQVARYSGGTEAGGMGVSQSEAAPGPGELLRPVSPYDMTPDQLEQLVQCRE